MKLKGIFTGVCIGFLATAVFAFAGYRDYFTAGDVVVTDDMTVVDDATVGGSLINASAIPRLLADVAVTLTAATNGSTYYSTDGNGGVTVLPAATAGLKYSFIMHTATSGDWEIHSAEGDNISGNLIVNSVSVPCAAEDMISFVDTIEELSDNVTLVSDGTNWYITRSDAVTEVAITCTDPS